VVAGGCWSFNDRLSGRGRGRPDGLVVDADVHRREHQRLAGIRLRARSDSGRHSGCGSFNAGCNLGVSVGVRVLAAPVFVLVLRLVAGLRLGNRGSHKKTDYDAVRAMRGFAGSVQDE
jgi:hypothetical protein